MFLNMIFFFHWCYCFAESLLFVCRSEVRMRQEVERVLCVFALAVRQHRERILSG